ncbi:MAG: undecaprenyl-phosphate glucose phosphotransferase [Bdellovibrionota bacterium]
MILKRHSEKLSFFNLLADLIFVTLSWILSFTLRFQIQVIAITKGQDTFFNYMRLLPLLIFCYLFIFINMGSYKKTLEKQKIWDEHFSLAKQHSFAFLIFVTFSFFIFEHRYSRVTLFIFFFITPILLPVGRSLVRKFNRLYLKLNRNKKKAIIIGTGPHAVAIQKAVLNRSDWNLELLSSHSFSEFDLLHSQMTSPDVIFIIPNANETTHVNELYNELDKSLAEVFVIPYFGDRIFFTPKLLQIEGISAIALNTSNLDQVGRFLKRAFDIVFSLSFIILFSPVFLICACLVRLSSIGPIFYKQERMGLDGKKFMCIKFRGMYVNAEENSGPVWAKKGDDRTTSVGKWLRKTSLDEIPQFFNVLCGDMSVVGPRPERPIFVGNFTKDIHGYMLRHKAKAGITGWAQINGWRGDTSLEKRIECDLWYIQNWSIWLDIKIVLLTPIKGLVHPNAY